MKTVRPSLTTATVLMSGGIDSAICAHHLRTQGLRVDGLFINYGQAAAAKEASAASAMADHLGIALHGANLSSSHQFGPGELIGRNGFLVFSALFLTQGRSGLLGLGVH